MNRISAFFEQYGLKTDGSTSASLQKYYPNLDGLRGIAIVSVLIEHWWIDKGMFHYVHFGAVGVGLFFVLSGFLIGRIILTERLKIEEGSNVSFVQILKNFYIRRALRIFPIYYLVLIMLLMFRFPSLAEVNDFFPWAACYLVNIKIFLAQQPIWPCGHFWTLSIEEQFYLIAPLLFFVIPFRYILHMILAFICVGFISRAALYAEYKDYGLYFTTSAFDYFGLGILLAYMRMAGMPRITSGIALLLLSCMYMYLSLPFFHFTGKSLLFVVLPTLPLIFFILIENVLQASEQNYLLGNKPIRYIGRISYGIYVYHPFIPFIRAAVYTTGHTGADICIDILLTLMIASASYAYIESPLNALKKKYAYV